MKRINQEKNCPNKELINNIITENTREISNQILEFKSESKNFTVTKLVETVVGGQLKYTSTPKEL